MLTKKQKNLLLFINKKIRSTGVSPSYEEMKNSLNLKSKSGIHRLISALEERGFIKRLAHKARALEVLKLPENYGKSAGPAYVPRAFVDFLSILFSKFSLSFLSSEEGRMVCCGVSQVFLLTLAYLHYSTPPQNRILCGGV